MSFSGVEAVSGPRKVLIATDLSQASQAALKAALALCCASRVEVVVAYILELPELVGTGYARLEQAMAAQKERIRSSLEALVAPSRAHGLQVEIVVRNDDAMRCLFETLEQEPAQAPLGKSPARAGGRQRGHHVTPEGRAARRGKGPIVFATDFSETTKHAIRYADALSQRMEAPLHCLHVLPEALRTASKASHILDIMENGLRHQLNTCGPLSVLPIYAITFGEDISKSVVSYAAEENARFIVLGISQVSARLSHGRSQVASHIAAGARCPVIAIPFRAAATPFLF